MRGLLRFVLLISFLNLLACSGRLAEVKEIVTSPSGSLHAALLFEYGGPTVGTRTHVAIFRDAPPAIGSTLPVDALCVVFTAYRAGPSKIIWEDEDHIALPVEGPLSEDHEGMIRVGTCEGVTSRWYREERETP